MSRSRPHYLAVISLVTLAAFAVRAVSLDGQSLWRDEVDALRFATAPWSEIFSTFTRPGWNGPLYFVLLRGWIALTGRSEYAMRFFSLACGVLCVPLVYALGCRLWRDGGFNQLVGFLAALLVAASPYLTWYSQEVKMYTLVPALALLAVYALRCAVEGGVLSASKGEGWHWWVVQVVATSLAFYSHILAALLIPVQVLLYFAWWPQARKQWVGAVVSLVCLTLPYLPLVAWQAPLVLQERETGFHPYSLGEMAQILLDRWSAGLPSWGWPWGAVLMGALALWGLLAPLSPPFRGEGLGGRIALACWIATPLLAVWLISLRQPIFTDRYLIWTAPAFYLLVAAGLASLWRFGGWGHLMLALLAIIIFVFNGVNLWQQATVPIKSDFRTAASYVADHRTSAELILFQIPYSRYTFDYYFPDQSYPWAEGLYTNHHAADGSYLMSEQEAAYHMQEMTAGHDVVWLVATETAMWDERGLVWAWLEANARRTDAAHFTLVDVYRYAK